MIEIISFYVKVDFGVFQYFAFPNQETSTKIKQNYINR